MSEIQTVSINIGTLVGTLNTPIFHVPTAHGRTTLTAAYIKSVGTLTSELQLLSGTALGTAITGTLGTCNATIAANVPIAFTISTAYVAAGSWIHLKTNAGMGTLSASTNVILEYKFGK